MGVNPGGEKMRTPTWKDQTLGKVNGFKIVLSFEPEQDINPCEHFIEECGWTEEEYKEISRFYHFTACITAYMGEVECGTAYLGACCYKNLKSVMDNGEHENILSGYAPQMIEEAVEEAKRRLAA